MERRGVGGALALPSVAATLGRGQAEVPLSLAIEMIAQAAAILLTPTAEGRERRGMLLGVDRAAVRRPLGSGQRLRIEVREIGRFGRLLKTTGRLEDEAGGLVEADLLLALEPEE